MAAGLEAARTGSTAPRSVRARIRTAVKRKAKELNVLPPELTDRIMKRIQEANALGSFADVDEVVDASNERAAAAEMLQRDSEYAGEVAPPLSEAEKQRYAAMDAYAPRTPSPSDKTKRDPIKNPRQTHKPPPVPPPGGYQQIRERGLRRGEPTEEGERRVMEVVKRLGLGATRQQIQQWARENWTSGTSTRRIDEYIAAARAVLRSNWHRDREDFMVDLLEQYQRLAIDARVNDQLGTTLGCLNSMAKLANMGGFANGQQQ